MKTSEKMGLNIPEDDDSVDINKLAENFEKIDEKLGNVGNYKSVSTEPNQDLTEEEKANARSNIGAGESGFSGSYSDLKNIPEKFPPEEHEHSPEYTESADLAELESGEEMSVAFGKIKKAVSSLISNEKYKKRIDKKIYSTLGRTLGIRPGYLRKYNMPKKIVCLGNSITLHGYYEADGISWTVDDNRAMGASKPNSDWVALVQKYITEEVNSDCKVYKSNISVWETGTNGNREYSNISGKQIFEVKSDKPYSTEYTVDTILDENTDIVVLQLSENMTAPTTTAEKEQVMRDFVYLFANIRSRCPNAAVYCFCGFLLNPTMNHCIVHACKYQDVIPVQALTLIDTWDTQYASISVKCASGDPIYDGAGNTIATISDKAAGHPNDTGFQVIATHVLNAMFNDISFENCQRKIFFTRKSTVELPDPTGSFFNADVDYTGKYDINTFEQYYSAYLDYLIIPGQYPFTAKDITGGASEGFLEVKAFTEIKNSLYQSLVQTWNATNSSRSFSISRRTILSANDITWSHMYTEGTHTPCTYSVVNGISDTTGISMQCSDNVAIISLNMVPSITGDDQTWIKFLKVDYKPIIETYSSASFYPTQEKNTSIKIDTDGYVWIFNSNRLGTDTNLLDYVSGQLVYVYNKEATG